MVVFAGRGPVGEGHIAGQIPVAVGRLGDRRFAGVALADGLRSVGAGEDRIELDVRGVDLPRFGRPVEVYGPFQFEVFQQRELDVDVAAEIPDVGLVVSAGFACGVVVEPVGPSVSLHPGVDHRGHGDDPVERVPGAVHEVGPDARIAGDVGRDFQPVVQQRARSVHAEAVLVELRPFEDAVLPEITHRQRVGQLFGTSGEFDVVVVHHGGLEVEVRPVAVGVECRIAAVEMVDVALAVPELLSRVEARLVVERHVVDRPEEFGIAGHLLHGDIAVVFDREFSRAALFRGDQDDAVGGLVAIDGGRCGVFEHRDRLDVLRVHLVERGFEAVDDDQRRRVVERADTAHGDRTAVGAGLSGGLRHLYAGNLALQGEGDVGDRAVLEVGGRDGGDGAGEFLLAGRAVSDDHDVVQGEGILLEDDVQTGEGPGHLELLFLVPEVGDFQRLADPGQDREGAVRCGRGAGLPLLHGHDDADDGVELFVRHLALDADLRAGLCMRGQDETSSQCREPQTQVFGIAEFLHFRLVLGW